MISRRAALAVAAALAAGPVLAAAPVMPEAMSLGSPKARIEVVEYASLTCPHCAHFNEEVFPAFKKKYVDTGKVRYTLKEFVTPPQQVAVAGWLIARCAGPTKYFAVVDGLFRSQVRWSEGNIKPVFLDVAAKQGGLTEAQVNACLADQSAVEALGARIEKAIKVDKIDSTPTLLVNGKSVEPTLAALDAAIADAAKGGR
ncbi:MAG: DsbA family protein [Phenylobacterium sp.]